MVNKALRYSLMKGSFKQKAHPFWMGLFVCPPGAEKGSKGAFTVLTEPATERGG